MDETEIDFTKNGDFKEFNNSVIKYLVKNKEKRIIRITDYIYPVTKLTKNNYEIKEHINLSGFNPLKGPTFISLTDIYFSKNGIVVCGLRKGVHPSNKEKSILLKTNVKAYCYDLVPTVIFAASLGLKIKATGVIRSSSPLVQDDNNLSRASTNKSISSLVLK